MYVSEIKICHSSVTPKLEPKQKLWGLKQILYIYFKLFCLLFFSPEVVLE